MSQELLNQLSLEYLVSNSQKERLENNSYFTKKQKQVEKDKKFYKVRIISLIKTILNKKEHNLPHDIIKHMDSLFQTIITHFKEIDKVELIQTEYKTIHDEDMDDNDITINEDSYDNSNKDKNENKGIDDNNDSKDKEIVKNLDKICMRKKKDNPLEKFVKITKFAEEKTSYPQQKKYKIKTPEFKHKGIHKKKNVTINYDEKQKEK